MSGVIITKNCYHYCFDDGGALKYSGNSFDDFVVFEDGDKCDVASVVVK
jgi:hypothetical protein